MSPDPTAIPAVLFDLADVLPQFQGADLESQLQTYDIFLEMLSPLARPGVAALLRSAAGKTHDDASRARIAIAARSVADGGRAAAPYDHRAAMQAYRAQYAANFAPKPEVENPPGPPSPAPPHEPRYSGGSRIVDERAYQTAIRKAKAHKDPAHESRTGGILERWIDPNGRVVAWIHVRYFHGEEDYDYFVAS